MDKIKIIFFDIDGTLIDMQKKQITPRVLETLTRLQERGIRLCIATGRSPMVVPRFEGVTFDAHMTYNGSYCYDRDNILFSNPLPGRDVHALIRNAAALGRPVALATASRLAANGTDQDLTDYFAIAGLEVPVAEDFDHVAEEEVFQLLMGCREADHPAILQGVENARIAGWWDRAVDIIPAAGGKGLGVRKILSYYGIEPSQAMAFGDGSNDIEMLEAVGHGIAMANASDRLKRIADDVCGPVTEDGIYTYCLAHGLI